MKLYYLTKKDFEDLGCNVITQSEPVTIINQTPMSAKIFKFKDLEELRNSDLIKDIKTMASYIFMYEIEHQKLKDMFSNYGLGDHPDSIVDNIDDAEELVVRLYSCV